ncbi:hypothetical protein Cyast_1475 [Cyanobacterium stanieri PCC 7202]|uniref:Uncharacterized protein n=1 Tax=Cyanobacterium stanieri (strain ATCC 29140 / PCC 7202) TaxID=292563 RepID=K9YMT9_CYASC|nr:hypothetical protein Cyast_1475 [Cyanobacterium stanieri PCC 7202]
MLGVDEKVGFRNSVSTQLHQLATPRFVLLSINSGMVSYWMIILDIFIVN